MDDTDGEGPEIHAPAIVRKTREYFQLDGIPSREYPDPREAAEEWAKARIHELGFGMPYDYYVLKHRKEIQIILDEYERILEEKPIEVDL